MHRWQRPNEPEELRAQKAILTREFVAEKRKTGKTPACKWPKVRNALGEQVTLQDFLSESAAKHCNYCDSLMGYSSRNTIDHFLPKSCFPCLAYVWKNLYLCCDGCQRKGTHFHKDALRPDEPGYEFARYFRYLRNGEIQIIAQDEEDRRRAEITLDVLDLNDEKLVIERAREFRVNLAPRRRPPPKFGLDAKTARLREKGYGDDFEDKPFRDFFQRV